MRTVLFNLIFFPLTLLWATGLLFTFLIPGPGALRAGIMAWTRVVFWLLRVVAGIRVEVRGVGNLPRGRAAMLVSKHMSDLDPIVTFSLMPDMTALAKKELFRIPIIGLILKKLGIVRVDRQAGTAHRDMPDVIARIKAMGRPLVVYPEGTRAHPGERRKLKRGVFFLQKDEGLDAIPLCTNSGLHWPKGTLLKRPGTVVYEIGEPLQPMDDKDAYMAQIEDRIIDRSEQLMHEDPVWPAIEAKLRRSN